MSFLFWVSSSRCALWPNSPNLVRASSWSLRHLARPPFNRNCMALQLSFPMCQFWSSCFLPCQIWFPCPSMPWDHLGFSCTWWVLTFQMIPWRKNEVHPTMLMSLVWTVPSLQWSVHPNEQQLLFHVPGTILGSLDQTCVLHQSGGNGQWHHFGIQWMCHVCLSKWFWMATLVFWWCLVVQALLCFITSQDQHSLLGQWDTCSQICIHLHHL